MDIFYTHQFRQELMAELGKIIKNSWSFKMYYYMVKKLAFFCFLSPILYPKLYFEK